MSKKRCSFSSRALLIWLINRIVVLHGYKRFYLQRSHGVCEGEYQFLLSPKDSFWYDPAVEEGEKKKKHRMLALALS